MSEFKGKAVSDLFYDLKAEITYMENDLLKAVRGNKAAGIRLRKRLMLVRRMAKELGMLSLKVAK